MKNNVKNKRSLILVVDDMPQNIQVLGPVLEEEGYDLMFASSGEEALAKVNKIIPDCILMDIMMPEKDGFVTCSELKQIDTVKDVPVIFLTARAEVNDIVKGFDAGGVDYVIKPFFAPELLARVKTHVALRQAGEVIAAQNRELTDLVETRDRLYSLLSHDLRNPLSLIMSYLEILQEEKNTMDPDEQEEIIGFLSDAAKRGFDLIDEITLWAGMQTGRLQPKFICFDVKTMTDEVYAGIKPSARMKEIQLEYAIPDGIEVYTDRAIMKAVLRNLVVNAVKFSEKKGTVSLTVSEDTCGIIFELRDHGQGIPEHIRQTLFSGGQSMKGTDGEKGSGFGLTLCYDFIVQCNGNITVDSSLGQGTLVTVTLPAAP